MKYILGLQSTSRRKYWTFPPVRFYTVNILV